MFSRALDTVLDRTVIGGYGAPGLALRRKLRGWPADPERMDGKVVIVTGATAGLGLAAAEGYAQLGAQVHIIGRDAGRVERIVAGIPGAVGGVCDVSSLASLTAFTGAWSGPLDVLVNNAGVMSAERALSPDGVELTFATNVLGPFVLIDRLHQHMGPGARIINVSSGGMYGKALGEDLQNEKDYKGVTAYARSKRAEVILTEQWAERLSTPVVHAMHPGWAATPGIQTSMATFSKLVRPILRTAQQGADTIVWLGGSPVPLATSGLFWHDRRPRPTHLLPRTRETAQQRARLWELCTSLAG
jgi:dehydrogenase/reductase SDR family protein 12